MLLIGFQINFMLAGEGSPKTSKTPTSLGCNYKGKHNLNQGKHNTGKNTNINKHKHK